MRRKRSGKADPGRARITQTPQAEPWSVDSASIRRDRRIILCSMIKAPHDVDLLDHVPEVEVHREAFATPTVLHPGPPPFLTGAIHDRHGQLIRLSQRTGGMNGARFPSRDPESLRPGEVGSPVDWPGRTLYLGHHMSHYGHFIVECLPVLWMHRDLSGFDRLAFHTFMFRNLQPAFMLDAYRALGLPLDRIELVTQPVRFEEVTIPERLVRFRVSGNIHARSVYRHLVRSFPVPESEQDRYPRRIYFSRLRNSLRKGVRAVLNEAALERAMATRGFAVIYPELLSLAEQIRLVASAEVLCGLEGSAMHNVVFARPGTLAISIGDARSNDTLDPMQAIAVGLAEASGRHIPFRGAVIDDWARVAWVDIKSIMKELDAIIPHDPHPGRGRIGGLSRLSGLLLGVKMTARLTKWRLNRSVSSRR
jgi:hypothetical protein